MSAALLILEAQFMGTIRTLLFFLYVMCTG